MENTLNDESERAEELVRVSVMIPRGTLGEIDRRAGKRWQTGLTRSHMFRRALTEYVEKHKAVAP